MEILYALRLVGHHQGNLPFGVLGGYPCRAIAGVACLRLNATQSKHKAARTVAPICAQSHRSDDIETTDNFAACA